MNKFTVPNSTFVQVVYIRFITHSIASVRHVHHHTINFEMVTVNSSLSQPSLGPKTNLTVTLTLCSNPKLNANHWELVHLGRDDCHTLQTDHFGIGLHVFYRPSS